MGANIYRFSLSWSRILPNGTPSKVNNAGIQYYNNLIDELISNNIIPMVILYHWDLPEALMEFGGWTNNTLIQHFANYARFAFKVFGDRVKYWVTINEPYIICLFGYSYGKHPPAIKSPAELPYQCVHTILKSHALAYRIYDTEFRKTQNGKIGLTLVGVWYEPESESAKNVAAAERATQFQLGWLISPVLYGKYPDVMRNYIDSKSRAEGRLWSRLPQFGVKWSLLLKGSWDFIGLNHYTTNLVRSSPAGPPGWDGDQETYKYADPSWGTSASEWISVVPWGFRSLLNWIKDTYGNPLVYVTENGFSDNDTVGLNYTRRINYYNLYINNLLKAIRLDGCNVASHISWSLLDSFEWNSGYTKRFGIYYVDFEDPKRRRIRKQSANFFSKIIADNGFH